MAAQTDRLTWHKQVSSCCGSYVSVNYFIFMYVLYFAIMWLLTSLRRLNFAMIDICLCKFNICRCFWECWICKGWNLSPLMTKPTKWHVRPVKTQISLGICPVWSVFAVRMKKAWVLSYPLRAQRRLIRLGGCPGWSESLLGAQSFCWFCHEAAHL